MLVMQKWPKIIDIEEAQPAQVDKAISRFNLTKPRGLRNKNSGYQCAGDNLREHFSERVSFSAMPRLYLILN
jgi:hypothetical protein